MIVKKEHKLKCRNCGVVITLREYEGVGGLWNDAREAFCKLKTKKGFPRRHSVRYPKLKDEA